MTKMDNRAGFTLVEMAVVLVIIGFVILTVFPALNAMRSANARALTQSNLHNLMLATATYVQANGCLPCPANAATTGANFGRMGYAAINTSCGACPTPQGIVPFAALGIPASTARDGWGHWITMRVDPALTTLPINPVNCAATNNCSIFAPPSAPCVANDVANGFCTATQIGFSDKGLCKTGLATTNRISVTTPNGGTQQAAVIFISHGTTGYGSYFASPKLILGNNGSALPFSSGYAACSAAGGFAQCNGAGNNSKQFYDAPSLVSDTDNYDDMLAYADRNTLVSMLGNTSCQTAW